MCRSDPTSRLHGTGSLTGRAYLPPGPFLRRIVVRSILIWLGVRGALLVLALQAGDMRSILMGEDASVGLTFSGTAVLLAVVALVGMLDLARRNERLLLANLGVRDRTMVTAILVLPAGMEVLLQVLW